MAKGRRMSIERKYDGEYCQIHVDLTNKQTPIQIFSKSGKDSTADRSTILSVLKESLRIGLKGCKFTKYCILEGELLVWSDKLGGIADFHKLRKFLPRAGTFIGIDHDSP
jgi:DNA ligase-4